MAHSRREHYSIRMIFCALGSGFCQTSVLNKLPLRVQSKGHSGHRFMKCTSNDPDVVLTSSVEVDNLHFWLK